MKVRGRKKIEIPNELIQLMGKKTDSEIAKMAGVCRKTIFWRRNELGIGKISYVDKGKIERNEEIVTMRAGGSSFTEIGKRYDISRQRAKQIVKGNLM